jgi:Ni/Co efflux regulator RcnB
MIKNLALTIAAALMVLTPVTAEARNRDHNYEQRKERKRGNGCGWLCGDIIGGVVVGALSSKDRERSPDYDRQRDYDNRYYPPNYHYDRRYCVREQITEWRYGERYVYWQTTCN